MEREETDRGVIPRRVLRRSMVISAAASAVGMGLGAVVSGNVFNRFLEFAGYSNYLYVFLAVIPLSNLLQIPGAWLLQKSGRRRLFFFAFLGPPRLLWLLIVLMPSIPLPERWRLPVLVGLVSLYWIMAGPGGNAWFSWMRDLIPDEFRGRYFGYRRVVTTLVATGWGLAAGYMLQAMGLGRRAFLTVYAISVVAGVVDVAMFAFVAHPPMKRKKGKAASIVRMLKAAAHGDFLRFTGVQAVWMFSCSLNFLANYKLMRSVGLEIGAIQLVAAFGTALNLVFSVLWGRFIDHFGAKPAYCIGILTHAMAPLCFALTPDLGITASFLGTAFIAMGVPGVNLANVNLLMALSRTEDMPMTMAARGTITSLAQGAAYLLAGLVLFPLFKAATPEWADEGTFFLVAVLSVVFVMRLGAFALATRLPEVEDEKPPAGIVVRTVFTTNPVTAFFSFARFIRAKTSDVIPPDSYGAEHPSARWRLE